MRDRAPHSLFFGPSDHPPATTQPYALGVVAVLDSPDGLLLDCREDCGRWALIGGTVDENESLGDALVREVLEETGLTVTRFRLLGTFSHPHRVIVNRDGVVRRTVTLAYTVECDLTAGLRASWESRSLAFHPIDALPVLDIVETHREIVDAYVHDRKGIWLK